MTNVAETVPAREAPFEIGGMLRPDAFPHAVGHLELRETHISWVILTGTYAYKIKKPVHWEFIDTSTLERRHHYCNEELRLNRRLAPEIYLEVVPITRTDDRLLVNGHGAAVEYAVRMRQFAAADELPSLLERNEISMDDVTALGELIGHFHSSAPVAPWNRAHEKTQQMYAAVLGNLAQLLAHLPRETPAAELGRLVDWSHDRAAALEASFQLREKSGFIRECHGDLHAANIVRSQGRLVPFDCLEFDPNLRWIDLINDVAFLVMDLVSHERSDLAFPLLNRYLEVTGDYEGVPLLPFYAVYRALVRAKVDALSAEQVPQRAAEYGARLRQRIHTAFAWSEPRRPDLILMHGVSGSGKSWLSERLVPALGALRIRSDVERKRLAGARAEPAPVGFGQGIYSPQFSHRTYGRLLDCAEHCLRAGFHTLMDAAFLDAADRELFHALAMRLRTGFVIVSCQADRAVLTARIAERLKARKDPSDADLAVLDMQLENFQLLHAQEQDHAITIDTGDAHAVARAAASIRARLARFP